MELIIKKVGIEHLTSLVDIRIEFIKDIHPEYDANLINRIHKSTTNYLKELFESNSYIGYLGLNENDEVLCTAGLLIYYLPPINSELYRKIGHVLNFYTRSEHRKKGYGYQLMDYIKSSAKKEGINRLVLNATKMGYGLYKKSDFIEPDDKNMILNL